MTGGVRPKPQRLRVGVPGVLALGSNLGDREATIRAALEALDAVAGIRVEVVSALYETPALKPAGVDHDAPAYLNAVARIHTVLPPLALLDAVNAVENDFGRVRDERWGDRTLDIDIVDLDGLVTSDDRLILPHPRAAERAFVLVPWLDVDPDAVLAGHGPVAALAARATDVVTRYPASQADGGAS
ncbi:2-amino-4-hydroxy-6-hydroxymethyldihydropteridine diphosphokinase [Leifsonia sp. NPDC058230]|uniref:2-amino-4-hydroxy-6- hydroxymethyldihydropteridine diphosphokinase n=1 Tax=Leifsonia sp. NPDC058230 TaxID=3346391 RepID=UPI0036DC3BF4